MIEQARILGRVGWAVCGILLVANTAMFVASMIVAALITNAEKGSLPFTEADRCCAASVNGLPICSYFCHTAPVYLIIVGMLSLAGLVLFALAFAYEHGSLKIVGMIAVFAACGVVSAAGIATNKVYALPGTEKVDLLVWLLVGTCVVSFIGLFVAGFIYVVREMALSSR